MLSLKKQQPVSGTTARRLLAGMAF